MIEQEAKLLAYRAKKQKEKNIQQIKDKFNNFFTRKKNDISPETEVMLSESSQSETENPCIDDTSDEVNKDVSKQRIAFYTMFFILWVMSYILFIKLQFGTVYLILSALIFICFNTRTGPRKKNEVSAYSVFNKNCESIDGTLTAEQFEREIRFGAQSVH